MNRILVFLLALLALIFQSLPGLLPFAEAATAQARHALVIGNGAYRVGPLRNPPNDAADVAAALKDLGFQVDGRIDIGRSEMRSAVRSFARKLGAGDVGLFFFAGHGVQVRGRNYLIPVGSVIETEADAEDEGVDAGWILGKMEDAGNGVSIMILDACRNNPFSRGFRDRRRGLASMSAPTGSLIVYATAENEVAADGDGRNGLFTGHLLEYLPKPGMEIRDAVMNVRNALIRETDGRQVPWEHSSLTQRIFLAGSSGYVVTPGAGGNAAPGPVAQPLKPRVGSITVRANVSGAAVWLNGDRMGEAPLKINQVQAGANRVEVKKEGYETYRTQVDVPPGGAPELTARLERIDPWPKSVAPSATSQFLDSLDLPQFDTGPEPVVPSPSSRERKPGETMRGPLGMAFAWIPPGSFMMGSEDGDDDETPVHEVTLTEGFWLQTTEVTVGQWRAFARETGYETEAEKGDGAYVWEGGGWKKKSDASWRNPYFSQTEDHPVVCVSWNDANHFVQWLNQKTGAEYRLPTEAQWEYAARRGDRQEKFAGTSSESRLAEYANFCDRECSMDWKDGSQRDGYEHTAPVGRFKQTRWGLFDMSGNVWEWTADWYGDYPAGSVTNPTGPSTGSYRVVRGGSWIITPAYCRSADRSGNSPGDRYDSLGFRLLRLP